jgi:hypothetical protein
VETRGRSPINTSCLHFLHQPAAMRFSGPFGRHYVLVMAQRTKDNANLESQKIAPNSISCGEED